MLIFKHIYTQTWSGHTSPGPTRLSQLRDVGGSLFLPTFTFATTPHSYLTPLLSSCRSIGGLRRRPGDNKSTKQQDAALNGSCSQKMKQNLSSQPKTIYILYVFKRLIYTRHQKQRGNKYFQPDYLRPRQADKTHQHLTATTRI